MEQAQPELQVQIALHTVRQRGRHVAEGEPFAVKDKVAQMLIKSGAAREATGEERAAFIGEDVKSEVTNALVVDGTGAANAPSSAGASGSVSAVVEPLAPAAPTPPLPPAPAPAPPPAPKAAAKKVAAKKAAGKRAGKRSGT